MRFLRALSVLVPSLVLAASALAGDTAGGLPARGSFTLFESGQVRPLALSPDGRRLFAVNTPDNRLEVFRVTSKGLARERSIPVGLEPVALAARTNTEVWVVNHLSDSVSIVDLDARQPRVIRTLLVGDEPRDIVFAGPKRSRAFVTTAHRGQNSPYTSPTNPGELATPGIGRADVWVFEAAAARDPNALPGIITLFGDTPRALAVSADGSRVYAAGFHTGNRTTTLFVDSVNRNGGLPGPRVNFQGEAQPDTGLIVKFNGLHWVDETGRTWNDYVRFALPDEDVFAIDAMASPPHQVPGPAGSWSGVGTVLFNMIVNPVSGKVYVSNTDARNDRRFEGPGIFAGQSVRGHLAESRITVLDGENATPRHLNKHIDYTTCCAPLPNSENAKSLAFPMGMAITRNGRTLYVAAFGSSKIGIFDTAKLERDTFEPSTASQIRVSGGGPSGLVLHESRSRLYVLTRFNNSIAVIDTRKRREVASLRMHNPEPASVVAGRPFLYDASLTSSHGDSACASCHIFADFDSLAWDLGDPDSERVHNPGPNLVPPIGIPGDFLSLKGPMTTQSLRGMANHGPMHWRGDRTGGNDAPSAQPDSGTFDEVAAFQKFSPAFVGLNGRAEELTAQQMRAFGDFILQVMYPPNPIRHLDNSLTPHQQAGRDFYFGPISDTVATCNGCHVLNPAGNAELGVAKPGFFGSDGRYSFESEPQMFKVPHLRNMYQKVGMFGMPESGFFLPFENGFLGDQVRGFGFLHDGSVDTLLRFHLARVFQFAPGEQGLLQRIQMEQFMFAFDSNLAPVVGQQVTHTADNAGFASPRIDLLIQRAEAGECELVARTGVLSDDVIVLGGSSRSRRRAPRAKGFLYLNGGTFVSDVERERALSVGELRQRARIPDAEVTYTCVPVGSGVRMGLDRDGDGHRDGDELRGGSDPADPKSRPR